MKSERILPRQFTEQSSFHIRQRLGRVVSSASTLRMPPMKPDFQSKESINRRTHDLQMSMSNSSPVVARDRSRFFGNAMPLPKTGSNSISNGNGSSKGIEHNGHEGRKTNTLSYSETIGPQTISAYGRKTDMSDVNTVFGITLKENHSKFHNTQLQESAHFGGSSFKPRECENSSPDELKLEQGKIDELRGSENSTVKSEIVDNGQIEEAYSVKIQRIPELRCNWFQFYTDIIYCAVSSLVLVINNIEYNVPFGLAKSLLASRENLETFLRGTTFTSQGEVNVDASFLENIKGSRLDDDNFVTEETVSSGGVTATLM
jgi:hypothetical protein